MGHKPKIAENIVNQYDNDEIQPADPDAVIAWEEAERALGSGGPFWLTTVRERGQPHTRPVLAVAIDGLVYTTSNPNAAKARNLASHPHFSLAISTDNIDFIVEGTAERVSDSMTLNAIAEKYREVIGWPVTVENGAFYAPYGAPTAGPPPYQPWELRPSVIYALGTDLPWAMQSTRWRF